MVAGADRRGFVVVHLVKVFCRVDRRGFVVVQLVKVFCRVDRRAGHDPKGLWEHQVEVGPALDVVLIGPAPIGG